MRILKYVNNIVLVFILVVFIYTTNVLLSNTSRGLDLTDEGYYILTAIYPENIFSTLMHEGHYTGLLYNLIGGNLGNFRFIGILFILVISFWFAQELHKYIIEKFFIESTIVEKFLFVVPILFSSLAYYKNWMLTPSYNWLAYISTLLMFIALFRIITSKNIYINIDYLLLSFSFVLSFMAKPTTSLILVLISILFLIYENKHINIRKALPRVVLYTSIILYIHIIIFDHSLCNYYEHLIEGMERLALMGGNHTLSSRFLEMINLLQIYFFEKFYFHKIDILYLYNMGIILLIIMNFRINFYKIYMYIFTLIFMSYTYFMFVDNTMINYKLLWLRMIESMFLLFIFFSPLFILQNKNNVFLKMLLKIISICFLLVLGSFAYRFGTNGGIVVSMSDSIIFIVSAILVIGLFFDKKMSFFKLIPLLGIMISVIMFYTIDYAYHHPYRIISTIQKQDKSIDILDGKIYVDKETKVYIEKLQKIAKNNRLNHELYLIDMTGGTPLANVILNASFLGTPWLLGGYSGSDIFTERILKDYKNSSLLNNAWILTAPNGKRKLNLKILKRLDLSFPEKYIKIGTLQTAYRNEVQELWKPK